MPLPVVIYEDTDWKSFLPLAGTQATFQLVYDTTSLLERIQELVKGAWEKEGARQVKIGPNAPLTGWCRPELSERVAEQSGLQVNSPLAGQTLLLNGRGLWSKLPPAGEEDGAWVGQAGPQSQLACIFAANNLWPRLSPTIVLSPERLDRLLAGLPRKDVNDFVRLIDSPDEVSLPP